MRTVAISAVLAAAALAIPFTTAPAQAAAPKVRIVKIYYDSPGPDRGGNASLNGEYVVLKNFGTAAVSLKGWTIRDKNGFRYTFKAFTLKRGKTVTLRTGKGKDTATTMYWGRGWYVWNNDKDTAYLRDKAGRLVHSCSYNSSKADYKLC